MKIAITGASGYIGQALKKHLILKGHHIIPIKRQLLYGSYIRLAQNIEGVDAIINLAGASILQRWTKKNRNTIYQSRILTTANLVKAIN
jgi:hypothetical protein